MCFGWCLAACAGAANEIAYKSWKLYASHVTGSTSAMAFQIERHGFGWEDPWLISDIKWGYTDSVKIASGRCSMLDSRISGLSAFVGFCYYSSISTWPGEPLMKLETKKGVPRVYPESTCESKYHPRALWFFQPIGRPSPGQRVWRTHVVWSSPSFLVLMPATGISLEGKRFASKASNKLTNCNILTWGQLKHTKSNQKMT